MYQDMKKRRKTSGDPNVKPDIAPMLASVWTVLRSRPNFKGPSDWLVQPNDTRWKWGQHHYGFCLDASQDVSRLPMGQLFGDLLARLTKSANLHTNERADPLDNLQRMYLKEVVTRHGIMSQSFVIGPEIRSNFKGGPENALGY
ncbi:hypothetical protein Tco_0040528 [Tanacetum coccineum]